MILDQIVEHKREEVAAARRRTPLADVRRRAQETAPAQGFRAALAEREDVALIAEIKRASPSAGLIREDFDPAAIAECYHSAGAAALSVLTDPRFFQGDLEHLARAKAAAGLPALRKDFLIDEYQVFEARAAQADAILLIARILSDRQLGEYIDLAGELGMAALVETHSAAEIERALEAGGDLVGINNRDLDTLTVDLATTEALARYVPPERVRISESGIGTRADVERLARCGVHAVLVGETLMRSPDMTAAARRLTGVRRAGRE